MSTKVPWGVVIMEKRLSNTGLRNAFPKLGAGAKPHLPQGLSWSLLPSLRISEVIRLASGLGSSQLWFTVGHSPAAEMRTRPFMYPRLPPIPIFLQIFLSVSLICFWMRLPTSRHVKIRIWHLVCYLSVVAPFQHFQPIFRWPSWVKTVHQENKNK